jgi:hypothetical protein
MPHMESPPTVIEDYSRGVSPPLDPQAWWMENSPQRTGRSIGPLFLAQLGSVAVLACGRVNEVYE